MFFIIIIFHFNIKEFLDVLSQLISRTLLTSWTLVQVGLYFSLCFFSFIFSTLRSFTNASRILMLHLPNVIETQLITHIFFFFFVI